MWWQNAVIYQIYPRSFRDTSGNGVGDLNGIIEKLGYLSDTLGVDALWISPFYPSPMKDFGYDVSDYCDVHPLFGTLADFDRLVSAVHARGMRLIIDWVPNHSSDQHPWFIESRSSKESPKREWYFWRDQKENGDFPNNWLSIFGGPAWEWDAESQQYYLHTFLSAQPDLNWRNPEVQAAMWETIEFWLIKGVDGFRVDVAHFIMKEAALSDNPPAEPQSHSAHHAVNEYDHFEHINDVGHPDVHAVYKAFRSILDKYSSEQPRMAVGEISLPDWSEWVTYYGSPESGLEFHLPFNFSLLHAEWDAAIIRNLVDDLEQALPDWACPNYVLGNHDEGRLASRYGMAQARVAGMLLLTLRGTVTLYYGDELGMSDVNIPPEQQVDPFGMQVEGRGRDGARTPMQWSNTAHAGFSDETTPSLWLPLSENWPQQNVECQLADPHSILNFYRRLLTLRKDEPALQTGRYEPLDAAPDGCYLYRRIIDDNYAAFIIALNFTDKDKSIELSGSGSIKIATHPDKKGPIDLNSIHLRANEGLVIQLKPTTRVAPTN